MGKVLVRQNKYYDSIFGAQQYQHQHDMFCIYLTMLYKLYWSMQCQSLIWLLKQVKKIQFKLFLNFGDGFLFKKELVLA